MQFEAGFSNEAGFFYGDFMKQHSSRFLQLTQTAKSRIKEITPHELKDKFSQNADFYLIDVREESEWPLGHIPNAIHISKGIIERDIEKKIPDATADIVVYCSGGFRCALVADVLQQMGYENVSSLNGGMSAWAEAGFPLEK